MMRIIMVVASGISYLFNEMLAKGQVPQRRQDELRGAAHAPGVARRVHRVGGPDIRRILHSHSGPGRRHHDVVEAIADHHVRTLAGAIIPELVKIFTSTESGHVREVVASSREGGASLNILSASWPATSRRIGWV